MTEAEAMHLLEKVVHEHEQAYPSTVEALGRIRRALKDSHQERWERTRDAVLPAIYTESLNHSMTVAEVIHDAALYADAAHGKLYP